ncbi:BTAD domain-containing putative transcriptional regulator [Kitasatospora sp. NPDC006697]|uniref:AfsR/SARP family transcriptional regulator n=1 Tax=Kitasatospora sp. NPDC006697 TaxID=3364020 RepID=UPI00368287AF
MELRLLGTVELVALGRPTRISREQVRCLLAALAVDVNRHLSLGALVERIWDGQLPAEPANSLYSLVSRLRGALQSATAAEGLPADTFELTGHAHTYTLAADPELIDYHRFRRLTERAQAHAERGEDRSAFDLLRQAEDLWQGEPLAGLNGGWATATRSALRSHQVAAALTQATVGMRLGRFGELVPVLRRLTDQHETNQLLVARLMVALYGSGRQDDALLLFHHTRKILKARLGTQPGRELTELNQRILAGTAAADLVPPPAERPAGRPAPRTVPNNLPTPRLLVGRDNELAAALDPLAVGPLVISGLGGTGKTSLATHLAHRLGERYPDAQVKVELQSRSASQRPLTTDAALLALLRALGLPPQAVPADRESRTALWHQLLAERRCLIILDDVADSDQVRELLPMSSRSLVLLTSRRGLSDLPGARHLLLDALPDDRAVDLFRALVGPERADNPDRIEEIVQRCYCHPYAVELAASRFKTRSTWTLDHLLKRLRHATRLLDELHDTGRDLAPILELSYRTLSEEHQESFRLLSLYPGPRFGQHAAAALLGRSAAATERAIEELLETHLLQEPRPELYAFHDLMAEFAASLAHRTNPGTSERAAMTRLVHFAIDAVDRADRTLYPHRLRLPIPAEFTAAAPTPHWADPAAARAWLTDELEGLLAVLQYATDTEQEIEAAWLTHVLGGHLDVEGYWTEGIALHHTAVDHWHNTGDLHAESRALLDLAGLYIHLARFPQAAAINAQAATLAHLADDPEAIAESIAQSGTLHGKTGDFRAALKAQDRALTLALSIGNSLQADRIRNNIGIVTIYLDDLSTAIANLEEALVGFQRVGNLRMEASALNNLGQLLFQKGDKDSARTVIERCLAIGEFVLSTHELASAQTNLIATLDGPNDWQRGHELGISALAAFRRAGERLSQLNTMIALGDLLRRAAHPEEAISWYQEALPLSIVIGADHERAAATHGLGSAEADAGRLDSAEARLTAAVGMAQRLQIPSEEAESRSTLAAVLSRLGRHADAAEHTRIAALLTQQSTEPRGLH